MKDDPELVHCSNLYLAVSAP